MKEPFIPFFKLWSNYHKKHTIETLQQTNNLKCVDFTRPIPIVYNNSSSNVIVNVLDASGSTSEGTPSSERRQQIKHLDCQEVGNWLMHCRHTVEIHPLLHLFC